ncbi:hypothetical protein [Haloplanus halobius]|uniref:hypothetical protein n=1 Tax=Haloplanus halobius TaxID=2934938 RepID=UPI0020108929|nr:hypothetical protein [Haloplanus sp. XH21]
MNEDDTQIGKVVGSNSHIDYVCEIYSDGMRETPPDPTDYEFGQFVYIQKEIVDRECCFIGVIYDTWIVDPDQGRTGPRLAQPEEQNIFQPSYVDEKQVLTGIALLGHVTVEDGEIVEADHSIPRWTLEVGDVVQKLSDEEMVAFHEVDGEVKLEYYQRVVDVAGGFAEDILSQILERLKQKRPGEADALDVIQRNLEWQTKMEEM